MIKPVAVVVEDLASKFKNASDDLARIGMQLQRVEDDDLETMEDLVRDAASIITTTFGNLRLDLLVKRPLKIAIDRARVKA